MGLPVCVCVQAACKCIRPMHALCYIFLCSLWWCDLLWINFCCFGQLEFSLNLSALEFSGWYTLMCAASRTCALVWPLLQGKIFSSSSALGDTFTLGHLLFDCHSATAVKRCNIVLIYQLNTARIQAHTLISHLLWMFFVFVFFGTTFNLTTNCSVHTGSKFF